MADEKSRWETLKSNAESGSLYLDPSVSTICRDACNRQITLFSELKQSLSSLSSVSGLGRFNAADELSKMLGMKAIGGERDFNTAFEEHIQVLTLIRDTIEISVKKYEDQQVAQAQALNSQGANIPGGQ
ncbi:hypothetical protein ACFWPX_31485 [Nocardia sp. NPDC058518]|uniref:hypothetical protein n=1 Tax=Nocardia sp. NPDC058518 TaxID=3346534 RepID=UPI0036605B60